MTVIEPGRVSTGRRRIGSSAPDTALPALGTAVAVEWRYPHQRSDLSAVKGPEFGQIRQQGSRGHRAEARKAPQELVLRPPQGTLTHGMVQVAVSLLETLFQPADMLLQ